MRHWSLVIQLLFSVTSNGNNFLRWCIKSSSTLDLGCGRHLKYSCYHSFSESGCGVIRRPIYPITLVWVRQNWWQIQLIYFLLFSGSCLMTQGLVGVAVKELLITDLIWNPPRSYPNLVQSRTPADFLLCCVLCVVCRKITSCFVNRKIYETGSINV